MNITRTLQGGGVKLDDELDRVGLCVAWVAVRRTEDTTDTALVKRPAHDSCRLQRVI